MAAEVVELNAVDPVPMRAERRAARRRTHFLKRYGQATTPVQKLDAAVDYFRATITDHRVNQTKGDIAVEHLAERLIASADQLAKTIRKGTR